MNEISVTRPRGLVPGSREWLLEIEGPRIVRRLADEVHAHPIGEMSPTAARCASMLLDRFAPTMSSVHHTIEGELGRKTEAELKAELKRLLTEDAQDVESRAIDPEPEHESAPFEHDHPEAH